jgi:hypothetical protein
VSRLALFEMEVDCEAFVCILAGAREKHPTPILGYQVGPNLWHMVIWTISSMRGPLPEPRGWMRQVNRPQAEAELKPIQQAVHRGSPFEGTQ